MRSITLSTGQTVRPPVTTEASALGATFAAPRDAVAALLPEGLRPVRLPAAGAAVTLSSVAYRRIGVDGLDPYDEFGVVLHATPASPTGRPRPLPRRLTGGYAWTLPVTTESARAFGVDVWGYPKVVADVDHRDDGRRRRTTVAVDGERLLVVEAERPPTPIRARTAADSYAVVDGTLRRAPVGVDARVGGTAWPLARGVSVTLGDAPLADPLRAVDFDRRPLARFAVDGELRFHAGEPVPVEADGRR